LATVVLAVLLLRETLKPATMAGGVLIFPVALLPLEGANQTCKKPPIVAGETGKTGAEERKA